MDITSEKYNLALEIKDDYLAVSRKSEKHFYALFRSDMGYKYIKDIPAEKELELTRWLGLLMINAIKSNIIGEKI